MNDSRKDPRAWLMLLRIVVAEVDGQKDRPQGVRDAAVAAAARTAVMFAEKHGALPPADQVPAEFETLIWAGRTDMEQA